jgi:hypothetical protein
MEKLLTGFLPKGKGTYIAIAIGILVIWGSFAAVHFGIVGESTTDALAVQACTAGANLIEDAEAKAAVIQSCSDFAAKPISLMVCVLATIALLVAAFLRRSISGLLDRFETGKGAGAPSTGPPASGS